MQLTGLHHISAITANLESNYHFFTEVLGLRLVKKTVNQDDPSSYHLFYADGLGSPGTEVTFFDIPNSRALVPGTNSISKVALRVANAEALAYWQDRFNEFGVEHDPPRTSAGRTELPFRDPEGQRLSLVVTADETGVPGGTPWEHSTVPQQYGIEGLGPVTLTVRNLGASAVVLTEVLGFKHVAEYVAEDSGPVRRIQVFATGAGGAGAEVHVDERSDLPIERLGHGGVHHVAFRVPDTLGHYEDWYERIEGAGLRTSGLVDRFYFRSIYFREPNGILYELATDGPGFTADEDLESLGERLALPPFLEPQRAAIEQGLKPLSTARKDV